MVPRMIIKQHARRRCFVIIKTLIQGRVNRWLLSPPRKFTMTISGGLPSQSHVPFWKANPNFLDSIYPLLGEAWDLKNKGEALSEMIYGSQGDSPSIILSLKK